MGAGPAAVKFIEAAADMAPAEGKLDGIALGQCPVSGIAIDLQDAGEAVEMAEWPLGLAVGRIDIGHTGRITATPRPVITGIGPQLPGLGPSPSRIENRRRGLVGKEFDGLLEPGKQALVHRAQVPGGTADPVGQSRAIEHDPLAGVDLRLPIQWQMIGIFGNQNLRHRGLRRQAAFDQSSRCRHLDHHVLAGPAAVFGPAQNQHPELGWDDVEPLGDILADPVQNSMAAGTDLVADIDDRLDARQMSRQRTPVAAALGSPDLSLAAIIALGFSFAAGLDLLGLFKSQQQLVLRQRLGPPSEAMALQLLDDLFKPGGSRPLGQEHRLQRCWIVRKFAGHRHCHDRNRSYSALLRDT